MGHKKLSGWLVDAKVSQAKSQWWEGYALGGQIINIILEEQVILSDYKS